MLAVFVLMAVDAVLPAGGELVMLFAGALAAGAIAGHDGPSLAAVIAAGTLGYLAGSLVGWTIGRAGGRAFIELRGRWLHIGIERFERAEGWFDHYGSAFVFAGRLTPRDAPGQAGVERLHTFHRNRGKIRYLDVDHERPAM